jgi:hypothetical protein
LFLGCDNATLGIEGYGVNFGGVGCMLHHQTKRRKRCVIGTSFIVLIQAITICSLLGGYHLFGSTFGESIANSLVPPLPKTPFSQRKKKVGYFNVY